jgi:hypothetical protein
MAIEINKIVDSIIMILQQSAEGHDASIHEIFPTNYTVNKVEGKLADLAEKICTLGCHP